MSEMPLLNPLINAPMTMTTVTPIATPRIVSAARILCARSDASAMPTPSNRAVIPLLLTQRGDRVEPRGPAGRIDAGDHAHARPHQDAQYDGRGRQLRRERADGVDEHRQPDAGQDAEPGADGRDGGGFRQELAQHVATARAERLA